MTIDEAIAKYKEITNTDAICPAHCNIPCDKCVQESEQLVEWLEELKAIKNGGISDDVCKWRLCDEGANVYDTTCRNPHILIEGTPRENNYSYCPYCGKKIKVGD